MGQENHKFKASLGYVGRPCLKKSSKNLSNNKMSYFRTKTGVTLIKETSTPRTWELL
jgi:hypothetical protein